MIICLTGLFSICNKKRREFLWRGRCCRHSSKLKEIPINSALLGTINTPVADLGMPIIMAKLLRPLVKMKAARAIANNLLPETTTQQTAIEAVLVKTSMHTHTIKTPASVVALVVMAAERPMHLEERGGLILLGTINPDSSLIMDQIIGANRTPRRMALKTEVTDVVEPTLKTADQGAMISLVDTEQDPQAISEDLTCASLFPQCHAPVIS